MLTPPAAPAPLPQNAAEPPPDASSAPSGAAPSLPGGADLETIAPFLEQIGFGAIAGFAAGYATKKVGKLVAIGLGLLFVALQLLAWGGFVTIDWVTVQDRVDPLLETDSLSAGWRWLLATLTYNVPFAAAFVPGFLVGLRRG